MKSNTTVNNVAQYTLKEAVVEAVNSRKSSGSFSAHDITETVRKAANDGDYALPGLESAVGSSFKYDVKHDAVKDVLATLLNDGSLANLGLTNVNYSGGFRVFEFSAPATAGTGVVVDQTDDADVDASASPVAKRIAAYIGHVGSATIRQIHSTLKINGLTSKELYDIVVSLGYDVTEGTAGAYSTYTVEAA